MANKDNKDTVLRQLEFPVDVYQEAEEVMSSENKRLGLITRKQKINLKGFLPQLVADGIEFRKGNVYIPYNPNDPSRDHWSVDQVTALQDANKAIEKFNKLIS